tara:strand:+ start:26177 stop:26821 length:645 start_codon:yes stop_codon:yes gene_type:complete
MANKKTHKKINKIKLKKNNKSKRKYKKKGAGQTVSRLRRRRRTRNQTPSPPLPTPPSTSELHDLQGNVLPQADVTIPPIVPVVTNVSNDDKPIVKTYSEERKNTVKAIMKDFGFNDLIDLGLKKELKEELESALLDYVRHGDNLITVYYTQRNDVEDKIDDSKMFVPGELRVLVKEWNNWRNEDEINLKDAIEDLIETLKTPEDTEIMYEYGNH